MLGGGSRDKLISENKSEKNYDSIIYRSPKIIALILVFFSTIIMCLMLGLEESVNNESDFQNVKMKRILFTVLVFIIFFVVCFLLLINAKEYGEKSGLDLKKQENRFTKLFGPFILTLYCFKFLLFTYFLERQGGKIIEGVKHDDVMTGITLACISMFLFGFLDNFGMMAGLGAFDGFFSSLNTKDSQEKSMYGNTFSDLLGAFLGMGVSGMLRYSTFYNPDSSQPSLLVSDTGSLAAEAFSIFLGCLLPILLSTSVYGRNRRNGFLFALCIVILITVIGVTGGVSRYVKPSQLKWRKTRDRPTEGNELSKDDYNNLIEELSGGSLMFTEEKWNNLNVGPVRKNDYVSMIHRIDRDSTKTETWYYQPDIDTNNFENITATTMLSAGLVLLTVLMLFYGSLITNKKRGLHYLRSEPEKA